MVAQYEIAGYVGGLVLVLITQRKTLPASTPSSVMAPVT